MRTSFVASSVAIAAIIQSEMTTQALPIEATISQSPADSTLAQTVTSAEDFEHADVAGIMMGFIGGIFQGMSLSDTFGQGRAQKENLFTTIQQGNKNTRETIDAAVRASQELRPEDRPLPFAVDDYDLQSYVPDSDITDDDSSIDSEDIALSVRQQEAAREHGIVRRGDGH